MGFLQCQTLREAMFLGIGFLMGILFSIGFTLFILPKNKGSPSAKQKN